MAITKYDQFDFLIDIVPREEIKPSTTTKSELTKGTAVNSDQVNNLNIFFKLKKW